MRSLPRWIERFLQAVCPNDIVDQITGDLIELYNDDVRNVGNRKAKIRLFISALSFLRAGIVLRKKYTVQPNQIPMLKNYFVTGVRHIAKSKINFVFKIAGLSLAIFSFLVIAVYVSHQLSFDRYHDHYESIYRVNSTRNENGVVEKFGITPVALGPVLREELAEVTSMARVRYASATYLQYNDTVIDCENLVEADSSIFDVLTFRFIQGDRDALKNPNSIVLTRTMAERIFGTTEALQKMITINLEDKLYEVTAVIDDPKPNTHLFLSGIIPISSTDQLGSVSIIDPIQFVDRSAMLYVRLKSPPGKLLDLKIEALA